MKKRNIIIIILAAVVIIAVFWVFSYFQNQKESGVQENQISAEANNKNAAQLPEFAQVGGKEILELLLLLQQIKLDIGFFQDPNFMKLIDFYKKIEILEAEKGNPNPFKKI